jgi:hypothetical protein
MKINGRDGFFGAISPVSGTGVDRAVCRSSTLFRGILQIISQKIWAFVSVQAVVIAVMVPSATRSIRVGALSPKK